ncbi:hypothetical protein CYLTODRAFT_414544 [Cylindrobasidium torrendii FP15055 ss-10]|uniref:Uncharacterized protein n=1 Tax=Cylindrobasidium torrendii FP15055 ss-10 TaxID=1314674 RepID=A0A0D7AXV2_9AGAR|nr:hypothetical protein CYLTODRAFT_414544 [Cylindrobasidium torrendii FP15055 ss-10]
MSTLTSYEKRLQRFLGFYEDLEASPNAEALLTSDVATHEVLAADKVLYRAITKVLLLVLRARETTDTPMEVLDDLDSRRKRLAAVLDIVAGHYYHFVLKDRITPLLQPMARSTADKDKQAVSQIKNKYVDSMKVYLAAFIDRKINASGEDDFWLNVRLQANDLSTWLNN